MNKSGFTVLELSVVIAIFLIMAAALTPFVNMAREHAGRIECSKNLMRISLALHKYARVHKGGFPHSLAALYPKYIDNEGVFDCPVSKRIGTGLNPDYAYIAGLKGASSKEVIAQDLDGNHSSRHRNILRVDGSVE